MVKLTISDEEVENVAATLCDDSKSMAVRFRALFTLKNVAGNQAIKHIGRVLMNDKSALLKHECAYCLGQIQDPAAIEVLAKVLDNKNEHPMVRHEAGEALGAIGTDQCLEILEKHINDQCKDVRETVQLAVDRINYLKNHKNIVTDQCIYSSIDPAPALDKKDSNQVEELRQILINPSETLFKRYQAMFTLRNINTDESALALASGLDCPDSALFRHEIAFVLGQMQKPVTIDKLSEVLASKIENEMVRHECAEALGAIATEQTNRILEQYLNDNVQVVKESAIVALDVSDYNNSNVQFQFLDN